MNIYHHKNQIHVVVNNKEELLDYLLKIDCKSEKPIKYSASAVMIWDEPTKYFLEINIKEYKTTVDYVFITDKEYSTKSLNQYDSLESFRYNLKEYLDYVEAL